ncbi:unnamed protein product [Didymodactylos carnosus]|nr:unnamed protein product [Didymodactylos carnosus]CAF3797457.1 unnamed protein product [Didymodactylos carnosus]
MIVYRGQRLTHYEFLKLKNNIDKNMLMNTFLSTTRNRELAVIFAGESNCDYVAVIFEIHVYLNEYIDRYRDMTEIDLDSIYDSIELKPFVNIENLSYFKDEDEILFSMGTLFTINTIEELPSTDNRNSVWQITMELNNEPLSEVFDWSYDINDGLETAIECSEEHFCRYEYNDEQKEIIKSFLKQLPSHSYGSSILEIWFAFHHYETSHFKQAIILYKRGFELLLQLIITIDPMYSVIVSKMFYILGDAYECMTNLCLPLPLDFTLALECYDKVLDVSTNYLLRMKTYENIGYIFEKLCMYEKSLHSYNKTLEIALENNCLMSGHSYESSKDSIYPYLCNENSSVQLTYYSIGWIHEQIGSYVEALLYYKRKLKLEQENNDVLEIPHTYNSIGLVHEYKHDYWMALENYLYGLVLCLDFVSTPVPYFTKICKSFMNCVKKQRDKLSLQRRYMRIHMRIAITTVQSLSELYKVGTEQSLASQVNQLRWCICANEWPSGGRMRMVGNEDDSSSTSLPETYIQNFLLEYHKRCKYERAWKNLV